MRGVLPTDGLSLKILVIRRDNIGDLVCTTPLLYGLRKKFPTAYIAVLASSYNSEVLDRNPDVDEVFVFLKKHQKSNRRLSMLWKRWLLVRTLRKRCFNHIILANGGWRYARTLGGKEMIGFREPGEPDNRQPDVMPPHHEGFNEHEVSKMARLGAMIGVDDAMGPGRLFPDPNLVELENTRLRALGWDSSRPSCAIHISSRNPKQRWPEEYFVALAEKLLRESPRQLLLFWSPGSASNAMHPGDDEMALRILLRLKDLAVFPCPTGNIAQLIAAMTLSDQLICSDGGAMHVAAALKKPLLCFFGPSHLKEWHPWHVPYVALQSASQEVAEISVVEAFDAFFSLLKEIASEPLR